MRKYYKYDTENPIYNLVEVGTLTKNNGVISGFSTSNYSTLINNFNFSNASTYKIKLKFITSSDVSTLQGIINPLYTVALRIQSGNLQLGLGNGSSWTILNNTTVIASINANTEYIFELEFTGTQYLIKLNDTQIYTISSTNKLGSTNFTFGVFGDYTYPFYGLIDLNNCNITVNDTVKWQGVTYPIIDGTSSDYDFYEDVDVYKAVKFVDVYKVPQKTVRKYYKYIDTPWTQPVLSADGTVGGDSFAVSASSIYQAGYNAWKAFDGTSSNYFQSSYGEAYPSLTIYSPNPLKISRVDITNQNVGSTTFNKGNFYGSNDGSNWTRLADITATTTTPGATWSTAISTNNSYNYFKIGDMQNAYYSNGVLTAIGEILLIATQQVVQESTSSDYDFYEDVDVYKAVKF